MRRHLIRPLVVVARCAEHGEPVRWDYKYSGVCDADSGPCVMVDGDAFRQSGRLIVRGGWFYIDVNGADDSDSLHQPLYWYGIYR